MALIDFGLVATVQRQDMDTMISAIIHLANRDYASLVDDFISLEILPQDCDRSLVVPLMDKALTPYVKGGGAKKYEEELRKTYGLDGSFSGTTGGFQAMTRDALTVLNDIPFSIPPYFALLGRAIVTLEGVALTGDPNYGIILESYPFVARKLLQEDRPAMQKALQQVLYSQGSSSETGTGSGLTATRRLSVLLNSALGIVSKTSAAVVDLDTIPEDAIDLNTALTYFLSDKAKSLRKLLSEEAVNAVDILLRQAVRKTLGLVTAGLSRRPLFLRLLPEVNVESAPVPVLIPPNVPGNAPRLQLFSLSRFRDTVAPRLSREEELYAIALVDVARQLLGPDVAVVVSGDAALEPQAVIRLVLDVLSSNRAIPSQVTAILRNAQQLVSPPPSANANSFATAKGSPISHEQPIGDLSEALSSLPVGEREVLRTEIRNLIDKLRDRLVARLQGKKDSSV